MTAVLNWLFAQWGNPAFPFICAGFLFFVAFGGLVAKKILRTLPEFLRWL